VEREKGVGVEDGSRTRLGGIRRSFALIERARATAQRGGQTGGKGRGRKKVLKKKGKYIGGRLIAME